MFVFFGVRSDETGRAAGRRQGRCPQDIAPQRVSGNCWGLLFKPKSSCVQSLFGVKQASTLCPCCASVLMFISRDFRAALHRICLASRGTHQHAVPARGTAPELALSAQGSALLCLQDLAASLQGCCRATFRLLLNSIFEWMFVNFWPPQGEGLSVVHLWGGGRGLS